jgi:hypothetical protein
VIVTDSITSPPFFFVYIYIRGCENKGLIEGVRFGAMIGLFVGVPTSYD